MSLFGKKRSSYVQVETTTTRPDDDDNEDDDDDKKDTNRRRRLPINDGDTPQILDTIHRLMKLAQPERSLMIYSAVCMALGSAVSLAIPIYAGKIIDLSLPTSTTTTHASTQNGTHLDGTQEEESSSSTSPVHLLMRLLGILTLAGLASFFRSTWQAQAGHRIVARLRRKLYKGILSQDAAYFDSAQQGDLISRLSSDTDLVQSAVTDRILDVSRNVVLALGAAGLLFYTSPWLALVSVSVLPPIAVCAKLVGRNIKDRQTRVRELHAEATSLAEQALTCITTVQQFVAEQHEADEYNRAINQAHAQGIENAKLKALFGCVMQLVVNLVLLTVLGFGGLLVQQGSLTPGDLASFVMYSVMMGGNISNISTQYIDLMKAVAAANRVFEIVDREPTIPKPCIVERLQDEDLLTVRQASIAMSPIQGQYFGHVEEQNFVMELMEMGRVTGTNHRPQQEEKERGIVPVSVQFRNVTFAYPTRPESNILNGLNLFIPAGQVVALVGGSGAGKSTMASLLTRLYDPQSGTITLNDKSIHDMEPQEVRQNIGIVMQEPLLFSTTIEANIRYGSPHATDEQVREAARLAYVSEFADKFPNGLQTIVGPRGTQLSGGQKQRVAVARCILKNPPVVILDESTSALDAESESQVQKAIDTACKGRTVIMIAHRLSTIRGAHAIAVLVNGRVAEMGSFEQLMANSNGTSSPGAFRQLMAKQLLAK